MPARIGIDMVAGRQEQHAAQRRRRRTLIALLVVVISGWLLWPRITRLSSLLPPSAARTAKLRPEGKTFSVRLAYAAEDIVDPSIIYDPAYRKIPYPNGDVSPDHGVCADVLIRAYRRVGIDLQQLVHEDMQAHFSAYPQLWGLHHPDPNIDHRRVFNLATFFRRHGKTLPCSQRDTDYHPGDIVVWRVQNQGHIGLVSSVPGGTRYLMVHNIGAGQVLEDMLFAYPIIGHYRYAPR